MTLNFGIEDYTNFPPGSYNFELRGCYGDATEGDQCSAFTVTFELENLCASGEITITLNDVFSDMTYYVTEDLAL